MGAYWSGDEGCSDLDAKIIRCVLKDGLINIVFKGEDDDGKFQGRVSLKATNEEQEVGAKYIYPDTIKEVPKVCDKPVERDEEVIDAKVTGKLVDFRGKKVHFIGRWVDNKEEEDEEGGCAYNFEIDADIENI